ncbi:MAG: hypothetical protein WAQ98_19255 [Blastocatellia bacterium]
MPNSLAHDETSDITNTEIAPKGKLNVRGAKTSNLKVIVKYPSQLPKERLLMEILLTDLANNQPITGVNITAIFNLVLEKEDQQIKPLFSNALATEAAGNYLAEVSFPNAGRYKLTLLMSKPGLNTQVIIPNIIIADKIPIETNENQTTSKASIANYLWVTVLAIAIILISLWIIKQKMPSKARH